MKRAASLALVCVPLAFGIPASAANEAPANDDATRAREAFREGAALIEQSEWARALVAFERSYGHKKHPLTLYNIGVCQRFLGRYTLAASTLQRVLDEPSPEMPQLFVEQARAYSGEIARKLARVSVAVTPEATRVAVDGRPLEANAKGELVAGIAAAGEPRALPAGKFVATIDPGAHVFTFQLEGHDTVEVRRDIKPGASDEFTVSLTEQDAELSVDANREKSVVRVDDVDVGLTPVRIVRPPGVHSVVVTHEGFVTYKSEVTLKPGQRVRLAAELPVERVPLTKKWWFWTAAAGVVASGALVTWAVTRPEPQPPPYQRGSSGWLIETR